MPLFHLGSLVATPAALRHCNTHNVNPLSLFMRHAGGDWGDLCEEDVKANVQAIQHNERLLSAYMVAGVRLYVITEWDRSITTLLLSAEY